MDKSQMKTPDQILSAALEKEEQAHQFYTECLAQCRVESVRLLLQTLVNEEYKHVHLIRELMARLDLGKRLV